jgi:putative CocE/NonD family hydrolase
LIDVYPANEDYPQACSINLLHGILRMRFRNSFEKSTLMEADAVYPIQIQAFPTSNLFAAGHRIRVDISSSNFPHFDINPNTGAPAGTESTPIIATNKIYLDRSRPSHIVLPIVCRPTGDSKA